MEFNCTCRHKNLGLHNLSCPLHICDEEIVLFDKTKIPISKKIMSRKDGNNE